MPPKNLHRLLIKFREIVETIVTTAILIDMTFQTQAWFQDFPGLEM